MSRKKNNRKRKEKNFINHSNEEIIEDGDNVQLYSNQEITLNHVLKGSSPDEKSFLNLLDKEEYADLISKNKSYIEEKEQILLESLNAYKCPAELLDIYTGPNTTTFELKLKSGIRLSKFQNLKDDIKLALGVEYLNMQAPIPDKSTVGIEMPNLEKIPVRLNGMLKSIPQEDINKKLLICMGKDLLGNPVYGDLNTMPHLLVGGTTGSGKSVLINSIISFLLMRTRSDEVKLVLIDSKKVEFTPYNGVPHLLGPVITDGDMANKALKVVVAMMDRRYDLFTEMGVRNIAAYNNYVENHPDDNLYSMTSIVVIIDNLANLLFETSNEAKENIQSIACLGRVVGIHLIVATQRPSVDVITGVIKANIPSRIAFAVSSAVDSRTILDSAGAERLLGNGDMLYLPNGETNPKRIQGVFITDDEVNRIVEYVKSQGKPQYDDSFVQLRSLQSQGGEVKPENADPLYPEVKNFVIQTRKASTSLIQRRFSVGYSRAAQLIDVLESEGIIGPAKGSKLRKVLVKN